MNPFPEMGARRGSSLVGRAWLLMPVVVVVPYLGWTWQTGGFAADVQGRGVASATRAVTGSTDVSAGAGTAGLVSVVRLTASARAA